MIKKRARNLSDDDIKKIVEILDGWTGKLTWQRLIMEISLRRFGRYTRQALSKHVRISNAFTLRKRGGASSDDKWSTVSSVELSVLMQRIDRLETENSRLKSENQRLLEQYATWAYNAHTRGLGIDFLSRPLPGVNREQTVLNKQKERADKSSWRRV